MAHDEFPPLTPKAKAVLDAGASVSGLPAQWHRDRRFAAAVIQAAVTQLGVWWISDEFPRVVDATELEAIADNLHSPPPPPPTGEEMESALRVIENKFGTNFDFSRYAQTIRRGIAFHCSTPPSKPPSKPRPTGGRLIRGDVDPGPVVPATNASSLVEMVSDAIAHEPWETEPQAAVLAVAKWLRSRGAHSAAALLKYEVPQ